MIIENRINNCLDIQIIDLEGNEYDINSIHTYGYNDCIKIVILREGQEYISRRRARELIEEVNRKYE